MSRTGLTNEELRLIEEHYMPGVRGAGYRSIAKRLHRRPISIKHAIDRLKATGSALPARRGRKPKVTETEKRQVRARIERDPFATNADLASVLKNKVTPQTAGSILLHSNPHYTTKRAIDREPREATEEWKETTRHFVKNTLRRIAIKRRIYADESAIYANEAKKKGRAPKGKKLYRIRSRWAKKYTLHCYARQTGILWWELRVRNANDNEILHVVANVIPELKEGDVLLWDQLGRSGRSLNPVKQHFNPKIIADVEARGAKVVHLPPLGKYLDPLELLFNDLKEHHIRPRYRAQGSFLSKGEMEDIIEEYMVNVAPKNLPGFFKKRANGAEILSQNLLE